MNTFTNTTTTTTTTTTLLPQIPHQQIPTIQVTTQINEHNTKSNRRSTLVTFLGVTLSVGINQWAKPLEAMAQNWGVRSFLREKYFEPGLSPEDAVARIKQTAEGLHNMRDMLEVMAWRYVLFYIRLKQSYLSQDLKTAMSTLPQYRYQEYVDAANELVLNMSEMDEYVRTPRVYESYVFYEKTLKSIDKIVEILA